MNGFTVRTDRSDGLDLRSVRHNGDEVASRVYFAVRDAWWRTVPLVTRRRRDTPTADGFVIEIEAATAWASHPLDVVLRYTVTRTEVRAAFTATAGGAFTYARIGFCVLLPSDAFLGRPATSWRGGVATILEFPADIVTRDHTDPAADRFHRPFDRLEVGLESGSRARYTFTGEEFEFEDQRNWTDPSYKAYSSPPAAGLPASTLDGQRFAQDVRVRVAPASPARPAAPDGAVWVGGPISVMPPVGLYAGRLSPRSYRPPGGFHDLNAQNPRLGRYDSIELPVNGAVHAADDDSVLETTLVHGDIVAQVRRAFPGRLVRLAPVSFLDIPGDWRDTTGAYRPEPPPGPVPTRLLGPMAATWAMASAARAVPAGVDHLGYFDRRLPADAPGAVAVARLAALRGRPVHAAGGPRPLAVLAVALADGITLAIANTGPDPVRFRLPDGRAARLDGFAAAWFVHHRDPTSAAQPS